MRLNIEKTYCIEMCDRLFPLLMKNLFAGRQKRNDNMKRYLENSIENMRDIGGYKNTKGLEVKNGCLIRSNVPNKLSNEDIAFLKEFGIHNVIDLRSPEEFENTPSVFENNDDFNVYHIEIIGGRDVPLSSEKVPVSYINMLEQKDKIKEIFEVLKVKEKVLYFCNAGKDRTGVVTALILQTLEVDKDNIIYDYILTREYMKSTLEKYANNDLDLLNIIVPREMYMKKYFEYFEEKYGTIEKYLNLIGISNNDIELIRKKYLLKPNCLY